MTATIVLTNGRIHTMDPAHPLVTAVAIRDDKILAVGSDADMKALLAQSEELRQELTDLLAEDVAAYTAYSQAAKMPRGTDAEKAERAKAMQAALKVATDVPLQIAEAAVQVMDLCMPAAEKGNKWAVSDAGVAVLMAEAALRSAALNVLINLGSLKDQAFVAEKREQLDNLLLGKGVMRDQIYDYVVGKL